MALNYTYLFDSIRQYISACNTLEAWCAIYDTAEAAIEAELVTAGQYDRISGIPEAFVQYKDALVQTIGSFGTAVDGLLADKSLCRGELPVENTSSTSTILPALFVQMLADAETLVSSVVGIGTVTPNGDNVGDATLLVNGILDGYSSPGSGWLTIPEYAIDVASKWPGESGYLGRPTELCHADAFVVKCVRDSQANGMTEGYENFEILGEDAPTQPYDWRDDGAGGPASLTMANGMNELANGEFETWTTVATVDTLSDWTYGTGAVASATVGTIFKESTEVKRGSYALQILGRSDTAAITLYQAQTDLTTLKRYLVAVWVKTSGAGVAAGTLTISFTGTGYTAGTNEKIVLNNTALAALTTYTLKSFWVNVPKSIPTDFALTITVSSTLTDGEKIYLDGMVLAEGTWFNGLCFGIVAGATPTLNGDNFTFSVTNTEGGVQRFFRKWYHFQLPSLTAASTITDTVTVFS